MRFILTDLKQAERNTMESTGMLDTDMQIGLTHIKREGQEKAMSLCMHAWTSVRTLGSRIVAALV